MDLIKVKEITDKIMQNISKVIIGKEDVTKLILTAIFAGGHVLIEDSPGTGKTMLAKSIARSINGEFKRVQFTPDLMPSDITGLNVYNQKTSEFRLVKGPVFTNIMLADEINRATPRTQSSLLEAMEERQVTIDGETMKLDEPFIVLATENPIETTGTYPLPEAQLDRFTMKIAMGQTGQNEELDIIERYITDSPFESLQTVCGIDDILGISRTIKEVFVHNCIRDYIVNIILETRNNSKFASGISTRGTLSLVRCCQAYAAVEGRKYVNPDDVKKLAPYVLGHRVSAFGGGNHFKQGTEIIKGIVGNVKVPLEKWEN